MEHSGGGWFSEYIGLLHDPAHILFEVTTSIVFDLVIVYFGYQIFFKRVVLPRLRKQIHEEIDREHELEHHDMTCEKCGSTTHRDDAMNRRCDRCEHLVRQCICEPPTAGDIIDHAIEKAQALRAQLHA